MEESSLYSQINAQGQQPQPQLQFPEQEHLKCPRCDSINTKFCYYNNYNLSQPRHFCRNCKRYWTKGGILRNIPVGGGFRKSTKRSSSSSASSTKRPASTSNSNKNDGKSTSGETLPLMTEASGSFSLLLASNGGELGNLNDGLGPNGSENFGDPGLGQNLDPPPQVRLESGCSSNADEFLKDPGCWSGNINEWPDLSIYTPGSPFDHQ